MSFYDRVEEGFIATYNHPSYTETADAVDDYWRVQEAAAADPDAGRTAIGRRLELPPSRVRGWMNGSKPDVVNGLETLAANNWFPDSVADDVLDPLTVLVATTLSAGSINDNFAPSWTTVGETTTYVEDALDDLGARYRRIRTDSTERASELRPRTDASVLGRLLIALGATQGTKNIETVTTLPWYLDDASADIRRTFARTYLLNRGYEYDDKRTVALFEERPTGYRRALSKLIEDVTDERATPGERFVTVSGAAADDLLDR